MSLFERITEAIDADLDYDDTKSGPAPGEDPFRAGLAELGWICSTSFVDLALRSPDPSVALAGVAWVPDDDDAEGRPVYFGDVVVPQDSPIESLDDLGGRSIACNDRVSLSGHMAIRIALHDLGHDPETFVDLRFTGGHHASLDQVAAGSVDVAVVDSVVRTSRSRVDPEIADLRIVARLGPWPVQPLVASTALPAAVVAHVRDALLATNDDPLMQSELDAASLLRFVPVDDDHYQRVREALSRF